MFEYFVGPAFGLMHKPTSLADLCGISRNSIAVEISLQIMDPGLDLRVGVLIMYGTLEEGDIVREMCDPAQV